MYYPYYYGRIDTVGSDVIGWSGHVYYDELSAYLEELNALSIVPLQFGGNGILNLELYINIAPLGEITKIKEFKLE